MMVQGDKPDPSHVDQGQAMLRELRGKGGCRRGQHAIMTQSSVATPTASTSAPQACYPTSIIHPVAIAKTTNRAAKKGRMM